MIIPELPWHAAQWHHIDTLQNKDRLPHALFLKGPHGVGKQQFAELLARRLLCLSGERDACGICKGCRLAEASSHPDFHRVAPLEEGKSIGIPQIRTLIASLNLTPSVGTRKLGLIAPAERMTLAAANSLLKTLEEPPGDSVLLLVSGLSAILPATVRSRCQTLRFPAVTDESAVEWLAPQIPPNHDARSLLALTSGQPLSALDWLESDVLQQRAELAAQLSDIATFKLTPLQAAQEWKKHGAQQVLASLTSTLVALARSHLGVISESIVRVESEIMLQAHAEQLDLQGLFGLYDKCLALRRLLTTHPGLNEQVQLEEVALRWHHIATSPKI